MNPLRLVTAAEAEGLRSLRVGDAPFDELAELAYIVKVVRPAVALGYRELIGALEKRDSLGAAAAMRRIASAGELGRLSTHRIEKGLR